MKGISLSTLPPSGKAFCSLLLVGLSLGFLAGLTQAVTAVGLSYDDVQSSLAPEMPMMPMEHGEMSVEQEMDINQLGSSAKVWIRTPLLIQTSHTHLFGLNLIAGLAGLVFLFSSIAEWKKVAMLVLLFGGIIVDIGGMWLTRFVWPPFAVLVLIGGTSFGLAYAAMCIISFYELWWKKEAHT